MSGEPFSHRGPLRPRRRGARHALLVAAAGGLALAGCANPTTVAPALRGVPAPSIAVALTNVGCTTSNVCVALGAGATGVTPTSEGEYLTARGAWRPLVLPPSAAITLSAIGCSARSCLIGGAQSGRDLLWKFNEVSDTVTPTAAPSGATGVSALSCAGTCALLDTTASGDVRLSVSNDGGASWAVPITVPWARGDAVTALACSSQLVCVVGATTVKHQLALEVTFDGGQSWRARAVPSSWSALHSLTCGAQHCVAVATTVDGSMFVRTNSLFRVYDASVLSEPTTAVACTAAQRCLAVGAHGSGPWLATITGGGSVAARLRYVPSPLVDVACGASQCAAIAVTTLLADTPT